MKTIQFCENFPSVSPWGGLFGSATRCLDDRMYSVTSMHHSPAVYMFFKTYNVLRLEKNVVMVSTVEYLHQNCLAGTPLNYIWNRTAERQKAQVFPELVRRFSVRLSFSGLPCMAWEEWARGQKSAEKKKAANTLGRCVASGVSFTFCACSVHCSVGISRILASQSTLCISGPMVFISNLL